MFRETLIPRYGLGPSKLIYTRICPSLAKMTLSPDLESKSATSQLGAEGIWSEIVHYQIIAS